MLLMMSAFSRLFQLTRYIGDVIFYGYMATFCPIHYFALIGNFVILLNYHVRNYKSLCLNCTALGETGNWCVSLNVVLNLHFTL